MPGYIYMIMMADGVYKVGRTNQEYGTHLKRLKAYPGDSVIVAVQKVWDDVVVEKEVLRRCREAFGGHPRGQEYFTGPEREFVKIIHECIDFVPPPSPPVRPPPPPPPPPPPVKKSQSVPCDPIVFNCPKCQKVFTHPKYMSKAKDHLDSHLNRKNACDGSTGVFKFERKKTRDAVPSIDTLDLTGIVESLYDTLQFCDVASHIFKVLNDRNCFAIWPNITIYEIYYMDEDVPKYATPGNFMMQFWNRVMIDQVKPLLIKQWPRYNDYAEWVAEKCCHGLKNYDSTEGAMFNFFMRSEVYRGLKSAITVYLKSIPRSERFQTRVNMGISVPES
jgi:hypothetical protein